MARKIIQISAAYVPLEPDRLQHSPTGPTLQLYALCDDGTLWMYSSTFTRKIWVSMGLEPIPQEA